ncbi:helix-turn-helix domain-containing protein [Kineosporia succinea]|uniref:Transcriptional regulator of acetoin/glycerol metabolism n=1 Tax=Kineosporia succinea TaxID=84632 RepID=A0ABT9P0P6_9ACTN|nr:helix-turn-helix domain-containing protein [Kineosporia succinea]MDP9826249.1 transcriptional regulator of acetoin/glycerol metabolism [Kineosporia succinea]
MSSTKRIGALAAVHESFLAAPGSPLPDLIRPVVAESWRRSLALGVDPETEAAPLDLSESELADYRANHPLAAMMPLIRRLLTEDADEAGHIVAVGDAAGRLLWVEGHHHLRSRAENMQFVEGSLWSEGAAGTNAPGTALALGRAVEIRAGEHFGLGARSWSCVAAPVNHPLTGELLGVIDLTGGPDVTGPRTLALVRACAAAVEAGLQLRAGQPQADLRLRAGQPQADLRLRAGRRQTAPHLDPDLQNRSATDASTIPQRRRQPDETHARLCLLGPEAGTFEYQGRRVSLSRRHTELVWLLASAPNGLSAQALDIALHDEGEHLITVRAEINRLRRVLGPSLLSSRPYRLNLTVRTDVSQVRHALAEGRVAQALEHFTGSPLPGSEAPGIRSLTDEFVCEVREAALASRDPDALERWVQLTEGSDDAAAWQALLAALPTGSPRQARARARLSRLA